MTLIQINKPVTTHQLSENFGVQFPLSDWVCIRLEDGEHETNRYDITIQDADDETYCVYLYMDEDSTTVIAIDDTAKNETLGEWYSPVRQTPFKDLVHFLEQPQTKEEAPCGK